MFHHFHDHFHEPSQGSLSASDFREMIKWLEERFVILNADEYKTKLLSGSLIQNEICFSFDDALRCQYEVAIPILEEMGIKAFFFVYSSAFSDEPDLLEIYRYFRTSKFENIENFYEIFFQKVLEINGSNYDAWQDSYKKLDYLRDFPFYSSSDKWFRYLRDVCLGPSLYKDLMAKIMKDSDFDIKAAKNKLWMSEEQLIDIHHKDHIIGLHSYSHPTKISQLPTDQQFNEYDKNHQHLCELLNLDSISTMSHPCGDYSDETLLLLKQMGVDIGFRSNMGIRELKSLLEVPREDHANILREMRQ